MNEQTTYYGPHACAECGATIVKASREQGGAEFDWPCEGPYPNHEWQAHVHRELANVPTIAEHEDATGDKGSE